MIRYRRPPKPRNFDDRMQRVVERAANRAAAVEKEKAPEPWKHYKRYFRRAQFDKCGYCECTCANHPGAVEHYAPKGQVSRLVCCGDERSGDEPEVLERNVEVCSSTGYHWLALEWDNWLLACYRCNSSWKGTLFPLREDDGNPYTPSVEDWPRRLLLNPFDHDPELELGFDHLGAVFPHNDSPAGRATIDTCGLHRISLVNLRRRVAHPADSEARKLRKALRREAWDKVAARLKPLVLAGRSCMPHAGAIRSCLRMRTGLTWAQARVLRLFLRQVKRFLLAIEHDRHMHAERALRWMRLLYASPLAPRELLLQAFCAQTGGSEDDLHA